MGVSFVHLLETYSIIIAATPLDRWHKSPFAPVHIDPN